MTERLSCYRCDHSLEGLPLPLGRRDECPSCLAELHVCRMCHRYDPREATGCTEEDALEVMEKDRANFCDYFKPNPSAYSPGFMEAQNRAETELASLFGDATPGNDAGETADQGSGTATEGAALKRAEDLFRS